MILCVINDISMVFSKGIIIYLIPEKARMSNSVLYHTGDLTRNDNQYQLELIILKYCCSLLALQLWEKMDSLLLGITLWRNIEKFACKEAGLRTSTWSWWRVHTGQGKYERTWPGMVRWWTGMRRSEIADVLTNFLFQELTAKCIV